MQAAGCLALHVLPWAQALRDPSAQSRVTLEEGGGTQMLLVQSALGASPLRLVAGLEPCTLSTGAPDVGSRLAPIRSRQGACPALTLQADLHSSLLRLGLLRRLSQASPRGHCGRAQVGLEPWVLGATGVQSWLLGVVRGSGETRGSVHGHA